MIKKIGECGPIVQCEDCGMFYPASKELHTHDISAKFVHRSVIEAAALFRELSDVKAKEIAHLQLIDGLEEQLERAKVVIGVMTEALVWCDEMLTARDEMNSKVHCAPVRLSPITERVRSALKYSANAPTDGPHGPKGGT